MKFSRAFLFCGCLFTFSFAAQTLFNFPQSPLSMLLLLPNYPCPIQKSLSASVSGRVSPVISSSRFRFCLTLRSLIHSNWFLWSDGSSFGLYYMMDILISQHHLLKRLVSPTYPPSVYFSSFIKNQVVVASWLYC